MTMDAHFGGADYQEERDQQRLSEGLQKVYYFLKQNPEKEFSLKAIAQETEIPQSSVGSYLCYIRRDLGYTVPKRYIANGLYLYRLGDKMTLEQSVDYKVSNYKPVGNKKLFGELMRSLYAEAHDNTLENHANRLLACQKWAEDMILTIQQNKG